MSSHFLTMLEFLENVNTSSQKNSLNSFLAVKERTGFALICITILVDDVALGERWKKRIMNKHNSQSAPPAAPPVVAYSWELMIIPAG